MNCYYQLSRFIFTKNLVYVNKWFSMTFTTVTMILAKTLKNTVRSRLITWHFLQYTVVACLLSLLFLYSSHVLSSSCDHENMFLTDYVINHITSYIVVSFVVCGCINQIIWCFNVCQILITQYETEKYWCFFLKNLISWVDKTYYITPN